MSGSHGANVRLGRLETDEGERKNRGVEVGKQDGGRSFQGGVKRPRPAAFTAWGGRFFPSSRRMLLLFLDCPPYNILSINSTDNNSRCSIAGTYYQVYVLLYIENIVILGICYRTSVFFDRFCPPLSLPFQYFIAPHIFHGQRRAVCVICARFVRLVFVCSCFAGL